MQHKSWSAKDYQGYQVYWKKELNGTCSHYGIVMLARQAILVTVINCMAIPAEI